MKEFRPVIFVIDPTPFTFESVQVLAGPNYAMRRITSWETARRTLAKERPDVIICEYGADGVSGFRFREFLRSGFAGLQSTKFIFVSTAELSPFALGPSDFWIHKRDMARYLVPTLNLVLATSESPDCEILFRTERNRLLRGALRGKGTTMHYSSSGDWNLEEILPQDSRWLANPGPDAFRQEGLDLFNGAFGDDSDDLTPWALVSQASAEFDPAHTHLRFASPVDALEVPFEFLRHPKREQPLSRTYPLTRSVLRGETDMPPFSPAFRQELARGRRGLRILVINFEGANGLAASMPSLLGSPGGPMLCRELSGSDASIEKLDAALSEPAGWDVLHYSGHGRREPGRPSAIQFADGWLPSPELAEKIRGKRLRLVVVGSCWGIEHHPSAPVGSGQPLSIAEALSHAGIPVFLVFRGQHRILDLEFFLQVFYRHTGDSWDPAKALQRTRNQLFLSAANVWAGSLMVVQDESGQSISTPG
jgi:hypothetical protein